MARTPLASRMALRSGLPATSPAPRRPSPSAVCDQLRGLVLSARYAPGARIGVDRVAADLGAAEADARAAVRALEVEGLLVRRPGEPAVVAPADPELFEEGMGVLASLEGYATAISARHLTDGDLMLLLERTDQMQDAIAAGDPLGFGLRNRAFHQVLYSRCPNSALVAAVRTVNRRLDAVRATVFVSLRARAPLSVAEHRELIDLLARGASRDSIEATARNHKLATVEAFRAWRLGSEAERCAAPTWSG